MRLGRFACRLQGKEAFKQTALRLFHQPDHPLVLPGNALRQGQTHTRMGSLGLGAEKGVKNQGTVFQANPGALVLHRKTGIGFIRQQEFLQFFGRGLTLVQAQGGAALFRAGFAGILQQGFQKLQ